MKQTLLLLISFLALTPISAQEVFSLDSIYSFSNGQQYGSTYDEINAISIEYDNIGRIESAQNYESSYGGPLEELYSLSVTYSDNGNQTTLHYFDPYSGAIVPFEGYNLTYNENGDTLLLEETVWMDNDWLVYYKTENEFDTNGNMTFSSEYELDYATSDWELWSVNSYTYNTDNRLESETRVIYPSPNYIYMDWKHVYEYDGNMTTVNGFNWDVNLEDWEIQSRNVYTYSDDLLVESYYQSYLEASETWSDPLYEATYSYDAENNLLSKEEENRSWIYEHELAPNSITVLPYFPYTNNIWENHFNNARLTSHQQYQTFGNDETLIKEESYFYSEYTGNPYSSIDEFNENLIQNLIAYPNPAKHEIYIRDTDMKLAKLENLQVLDLHGRVVKQYLDGDDKIDIQSLPVGPFVIIGEKSGQSFKTTFIKE